MAAQEQGGGGGCQCEGAWLGDLYEGDLVQAAELIVEGVAGGEVAEAKVPVSVP